MKVKHLSPTRKKAHKKILDRAKGYRGRAKSNYRVAKQAVIRAAAYSYAHRKKRYGDFRTIWIQRINAFARMHDMTYSSFIHAFNSLVAANKIEYMNRKILSEIIVNDNQTAEYIIQNIKNN